LWEMAKKAPEYKESYNMAGLKDIDKN